MLLTKLSFGRGYYIHHIAFASIPLHDDIALAMKTPQILAQQMHLHSFRMHMNERLWLDAHSKWHYTIIKYSDVKRSRSPCLAL